MADTILSNKLFSTRNVVLNELYIVNSFGDILSLKNIFNLLNLYEDIYSCSMYGSIQLIDGIAAFANLGLHGNEYLHISFNRPGETDDYQKFRKSFRIYKATNREPNGAVQSYVLHFCSEEQVFNNQVTLSKTFKNASPTDYVLDVCKHNLKINTAKIDNANFEKSMGSTEYVMTRHKPFEAIKLFEANAYNTNESPFLFFENRLGYNFMSLETLFTRDPIAKLHYNTVKLTEEQDDAPFKNSTDVSNFSFDSVFDVLGNTKKPAYSGRLYTLDLIGQKYKRFDYSALDAKAQRSMSDKNYPFNNAKNRNNKALYEEYETDVNLWLTNLDQSNQTYLRSKAYRVNSTNIEKTILQRKAQLNLLNGTVLKVAVAGNPQFSVGFTIDFDLPAMTPNGKAARLIDPYHSGKYLITHVRHTLSPSTELQTFLTLAKNSVATPHSVTNSPTEYVKARNI